MKKNPHMFLLCLFISAMIIFSACTTSTSSKKCDNTQGCWKKYQMTFKNELEQLKVIDQDPNIQSSIKIAKWKTLLKKFYRNNPFSREDELFKEYILKRIQVLKNKPQTEIAGSQESYVVTIKSQIEQKSKTPTEIMTTHWINNHNYAIVSKLYTIIFNLKTKKGAFLLHKSKKYVNFQLPLDLSEILPKSTLNAASGYKATAHVTSTSQEKKINDYICNEYEMEIRVRSKSYKTRIWSTEQVPFNWKLYQDNLLRVTMYNFLFDDASINELKKIKGFWISSERKTEISEKNVGSTSDVLNISKVPAPQGIFAIPQSYTKQDFLVQSEKK